MLSQRAQQELYLSVAGISEEQMSFSARTKAGTRIFHLSDSLCFGGGGRMRREFGVVSLFARERERQRGERAPRVHNMRAWMCHVFIHLIRRVCVPRGATDMPLFGIISNPARLKV